MECTQCHKNKTNNTKCMNCIIQNKDHKDHKIELPKCNTNIIYGFDYCLFCSKK